jgi:NEDD8-activating enzyme E1
MPRSATLQDLIDKILEEPKLQIKSPSLRTASTSLYMRAPKPLEVQTRPNLVKTLGELVSDGEEITVTGVNIPVSVRVVITLTE